MGEVATRGLNVTRKQLLITLAVGAAIIAGIAQFFSGQDSYIPGVFWTIVGLDAMRYGWKNFQESREDERAATTARLDGPEHVATLASIRREFLWLTVQMLFILVGVLSTALLVSRSVDWPAATNDAWIWFQATFWPRFFVGTFLYAAFVMWLNRRLDSTVSARMRAARKKVK